MKKWKLLFKVMLIDLFKLFLVLFLVITGVLSCFNVIPVVYFLLYFSIISSAIYVGSKLNKQSKPSLRPKLPKMGLNQEMDQLNKMMNDLGPMLDDLMESQKRQRKHFNNRNNN